MSHSRSSSLPPVTQRPHSMRSNSCSVSSPLPLLPSLPPPPIPFPTLHPHRRIQAAPMSSPSSIISVTRARTAHTFAWYLRSLEKTCSVSSKGIRTKVSPCTSADRSRSRSCSGSIICTGVAASYTPVRHLSSLLLFCPQCSRLISSFTPALNFPFSTGCYPFQIDRYLSGPGFII